MFLVQNNLWICVLLLWIHKKNGVELLVLNVSIKAFWFTKIFSTESKKRMIIKHQNIIDENKTKKGVW